MKNSQNYLEVHKGTRDFLIKFRGVNRKFIFNTSAGLLELLKSVEKYGIEYIKEFDPRPDKLRFKRASVKTVIMSFQHNTELAIDHFKKDSFFRSHYKYMLKNPFKSYGR